MRWDPRLPRLRSTDLKSYLPHGQLYVAASRVGHPSHIRFAVEPDDATGEFRTRNVVWGEALTPAVHA